MLFQLNVFRLLKEQQSDVLDFEKSILLELKTVLVLFHLWNALILPLTCSGRFLVLEIFVVRVLAAAITSSFHHFSSFPLCQSHHLSFLPKHQKQRLSIKFKLLRAWTVRIFLFIFLPIIDNTSFFVPFVFFIVNLFIKSLFTAEVTRTRNRKWAPKISK